MAETGLVAAEEGGGMDALGSRLLRPPGPGRCLEDGYEGLSPPSLVDLWILVLVHILGFLASQVGALCLSLLHVSLLPPQSPSQWRLPLGRLCSLGFSLPLSPLQVVNVARCVPRFAVSLGELLCPRLSCWELIEWMSSG